MTGIFSLKPCNYVEGAAGMWLTTDCVEGDLVTVCVQYLPNPGNCVVHGRKHTLQPGSRFWVKQADLIRISPPPVAGEPA